MGRNKKIRSDEEDEQEDQEVPRHLETGNDETELSHYVEGKKIKTTKRKYGIKSIRKKGTNRS